MKRKFIKVFFAIMFAGAILFGCGQAGPQTAQAVNDPAFEIVSQERIDIKGYMDSKLTVVKHKETGKRFVIYTGDKKGGIVPLD